MSEVTKKFYIINTTEKIHCLNHITGPITKPTEMSMTDALGLVKQGMEVYEVNPYNNNEKVKVTPFNYNNIQFKTSYYDMIRRRKLNEEMQRMSSDNSKTNQNVKKDEVKKEDNIKEDSNKKKEPEKPVDTKTDNSKVEKPQHTDFQKH